MKRNNYMTKRYTIGEEIFNSVSHGVSALPYLYLLQAVTPHFALLLWEEALKAVL